MQALTVLWEAADRICGKQLKAIIPTLIEVMDRHKHISLDSEVRRHLLQMSAATIDRRLGPAREAGKQKRRRSHINTPLRKSIAVRTFNDWNDPALFGVKNKDLRATFIIPYFHDSFPVQSPATITASESRVVFANGTSPKQT